MYFFSDVWFHHFIRAVSCTPRYFGLLLHKDCVGHSQKAIKVRAKKRYKPSLDWNFGPMITRCVSRRWGQGSIPARAVSQILHPS